MMNQVDLGMGLDGWLTRKLVPPCVLSVEEEAVVCSVDEVLGLQCPWTKQITGAGFGSLSGEAGRLVCGSVKSALPRCLESTEY